MNIDVASLASRAVRSSIGKRIFSAGSGSFTKSTGGFLGFLFNGFLRFTGFVLKDVAEILGSFFSWSWSTLWGLIVSATTFIFNFNFNASDEDLNQTAENALDNIAVLVGSTLGNAIGSIACGIVPGVIMFCFNEALGLYVLEHVGEAAAQALAGHIASLIQVSAESAIQFLLIQGYKNIRKLWRKSPEELKKELQAQGKTEQDIRKALEEGRKPWTINHFIEEKGINSISSQKLRLAASALLQEAGQSCIQSGYVVAQSLDSYFAEQKAASDILLGNEKAVEITFNRSQES